MPLDGEPLEPGLFPIMGKSDTSFAPSPVVMSGWELCSEAIIASLHQCKLFPTLFPTDHPAAIFKWKSRGIGNAPLPHLSEGSSQVGLE